MARREPFAFENVSCSEGKKPSFFKSNICSSSRIRLVRRFRMPRRCFGERVNCTAAQQCGVFYLLSDIIEATFGGRLMTDYSVFESNRVCCTTRRYYLDKKSCFLASRERRCEGNRLAWFSRAAVLFHVEITMYYRILARRAPRTRRRGISDERRVCVARQ